MTINLKTIATTLLATAAANAAPVERDWPSVVVAPIIDLPMRDTAITRGPEETPADAKTILVTAVARSVDKSWVFAELGTKPVKTPAWDVKERGPVRVEPVKAVIELKRKDVRRVIALDHGGQAQNPVVELPVEKIKDGIRLTPDGTKTKTMYYPVKFKQGK